MSFFGFDTSGHNTKAPGFGQTQDPFAGLSSRDDDADALEFEDTYDGLADQLDETGDDFNDDTFGGGGGSSGPAPPGGGVGKDFDFFGATAKVSNAFEEEHLRFNRHQPITRSAAPPTSANQSGWYYSGSQNQKPTRSGYEKYKEEPLPELQADASIWGMPKKTTATPSSQLLPQVHPIPVSSSAPKMMSLEEVEAAMRSHQRPSQPVAIPSAQQHQASPFEPSDFLHAQMQQNIPLSASHDAQRMSDVQMRHHQTGQGNPMAILQRAQAQAIQPGSMPTSSGISQLHAQVNRQQQQQQNQQQIHLQSPSSQPPQAIANANLLAADALGQVLSSSVPLPDQHIHQLQASLGHQPNIITHPSQLSHLTESQKAAYLDQDTKRAKRNHKIFLLSKDNGLMTPQDKNFITRIQLQQLVSATGNPNEQGTDEALAEDFYYQVHSQIRGGHRQHPGQPLNNFAQTYLFQTGSRHNGMRRHHRGPENHVQRMEQQVQRAVEAAKNKPKNKQLVIEGSLGKISFSNAKTPKPLLNIKRNENNAEAQRPNTANKEHDLVNGIDRRATLRNVERVYTTLMKMEDHDRLMPPPPQSESDTDLVELHAAWNDTANKLNGQLWRELRFHEPIHEPIGSGPIHPFIAFLSFSKGKKAIPRIFRHTTHEQRTTILTMIVVHLDQLDVTRGAQIDNPNGINAAMREEIARFSSAVTDTLFNFMNDLDLQIVAAVLGLICQRNLDIIAKARTGISILTMILSRAEIIKQTGGGNDQGWKTWESTYDTFFNILEPILPYIFPGSVNSGEDVYVWQLLAAIGIGAGPSQQQRLVLAVKDRVMDTVSLAKTLPPDMASERLQTVNLFMRSIGLDVELLQ